jgi:hypothetical protein
MSIRGAFRTLTRSSERKYETTFDYRLPSSGPQKVTFESFHRVEVATCLPVVVEP